MEYVVKAEIGGKTLSIKTGKLAKQSSGSALVTYGDTAVLACATSAGEPQEVNFLPLSVEYQEKIYSAGRIPGNYFRREIGRPSEKETLTARLIDRPLRPLFLKKYNYETQVIATVLSMDKENEPDILAMIGASAALTISDIPFAGPIAGIRICKINNEFVINPTIEQIAASDMEIVLAGSETGIVMVEGNAMLSSEEEVLKAILFGHEAMQPIIKIQKELQDAVGMEKRIFTPPSEDEKIIKDIEENYYQDIRQTLLTEGKINRNKALSALKEKIHLSLGEEYTDRKKEVSESFSNIKKKISRDLILKEGIRIDKRKFDEIRPISCETGILPRPHGSALFTRGETQVLGIMTLGSGQDGQRIETLNGDEVRKFMLHYNFPPFSVGEVKRAGGPSRRDIGHGRLARAALAKVMPDKEEFDYIIRLVGEVLESNGSSSMGTVCAGSLALMDGGVPIKAPVAGIAMGLISGEGKTVILSDIMGDEDHSGDMDFKVAGTSEGITAIQMDIKISEISETILKEALEQAREGRIFILNKMLETLDKPRKEVSTYAPSITTVKIHPDKIRVVIGPGGKVIKSIQDETGTKIEIEDTGLIKIAASSAEEAEAAKKLVLFHTQTAEEGKIYEGEVVKITDFGAFVRILPNTDGLVHISQLADHHVKKVTDIVKEGEKIKVKVLAADRNGKIRLSLKAAIADEKNMREKNTDDKDTSDE
ncbi:MAG: polyribonucleotide nucleotidyltransferase [Deltaproteobacteria bacterium]|nr:polyribonucleotide nucleotidyltransferase [Deltaproteobacteria bacterium]